MVGFSYESWSFKKIIYYIKASAFLNHEVRLRNVYTHLINLSNACNNLDEKFTYKSQQITFHRKQNDIFSLPLTQHKMKFEKKSRQKYKENSKSITLASRAFLAAQ